MRGATAGLCFFLLLTILGLSLGVADWNRRSGDVKDAAAHQEGYDAGRARIPVEACPEDVPDRVRAWKRGWIEGRKGVSP